MGKKRSLGSLIFNLLTTSQDTSVWNTGKGFYGTVELGPFGAPAALIGTSLLQNLSVAVSEEVHYRGTAHHSIERSLHPVMASVIIVLPTLLAVMQPRSLLLGHLTKPS